MHIEFSDITSYLLQIFAHNLLYQLFSEDQIKDLDEDVPSKSIDIRLA